MVTVAGLFIDESTANAALDVLRQAGVAARAFHFTDMGREPSEDYSADEEQAAAIAGGASIGAAAGAATTWLLATAVPGLGAAPLAGAAGMLGLGGAASGLGAVAGGLIGGLMDNWEEPDSAPRRPQGVIVVARQTADADVVRLERLLREAGAERVTVRETSAR